MSSGLEDFSLFDLFRMEAEEQVHVLRDELLKLEQSLGAPSRSASSNEMGSPTATLECLMRAAHSIKGAARIVGLDAIVHLTHAVEDRFVAAQHGSPLSSAEIDQMLTATDWLARLQAVPETEAAGWLAANSPAIAAFTATFQPAANAGAPFIAPLPHAMSGSTPEFGGATPTPRDETVMNGAQTEPEDDLFTPRTLSGAHAGERQSRHVRIAAERFDQILSLASESLVSSRNIALHADLFERNRRVLAGALQTLEDPESTSVTRAAARRDMARQINELSVHFAEFNQSSSANEVTTERLYRAVLAGRLRPFADGITAVSRLVRDTSRDLGKQVHLEILGEQTRVDRDILERLEAPISHLLTNAIDHGIETPAARLAAGKPETARLRLHARHENGRLVITVRDDGRGIHFDELRERIIARGLVKPETAAGLSEAELLEFIFLPGFSTRNQANAVSGRGVGLNIVQSMVQEAGGSVVVTSTPGAGTLFRLTLPVTRSVIKVIRVLVEGELYAVPLVRIDRVAHLQPTSTDDPDAPTFTPQESPTVSFDGGEVPVFTLASLLGLSSRTIPPGAIPLILSGGVAFAVDRLVDEVELPVRRLDPRLGKVPGVSSASLDEDGLPILILDMEDLIQTAQGRPALREDEGLTLNAPHILIVDDSHTVREMERRLLVRAGYQVTAAQNGQEAWNLLRLNDYDLLISDVDMPQMNGIELVTRLRDNPRLARMPVMILSYKDREEDRQRGLDAGADFYLTKGDFQNENFRQAVVDLIGPGEAYSANETNP